jgi:hypothetical protein
LHQLEGDINEKYGGFAANEGTHVATDVGNPFSQISALRRRQCVD